jgi:uncharacterized membrane protein YbhN (UPF0104 family)
LWLKRYVSKSIAQAFGYYIAFLTISGMLFVAVLALISSGLGVTTLQILTLCGAFVIAWLAGLLTPGAPAGVGVRELVLMLLLKDYIIESDLLLAVLLSRLVTVTGDVLYYLFSSSFKNNSLHQNNNKIQH